MCKKVVWTYASHSLQWIAASDQKVTWADTVAFICIGSGFPDGPLFTTNNNFLSVSLTKSPVLWERRPHYEKNLNVFPYLKKEMVNLVVWLIRRCPSGCTWLFTVVTVVCDLAVNSDKIQRLFLDKSWKSDFRNVYVSTPCTRQLSIYVLHSFISVQITLE